MARLSILTDLAKRAEKYPVVLNVSLPKNKIIHPAGYIVNADNHELVFSQYKPDKGVFEVIRFPIYDVGDDMDVFNREECFQEVPVMEKGNLMSYLFMPGKHESFTLEDTLVRLHIRTKSRGQVLEKVGVGYFQGLEITSVAGHGQIRAYLAFLPNSEVEDKIKNGFSKKMKRGMRVKTNISPVTGYSFMRGFDFSRESTLETISK